MTPPPPHSPPHSIDELSLASLAIFPLPDVVLFPGTVLPLHVFEPRYRDMARDVLAGDRVLAVARLRPGYEGDYQGRPPVFETAGVGVIVADDELDGGRYNILLRGVGRVAIEQELPPEKSYRRVRARLLSDAISGRPQLASATHSQLVAMCERLADAIGDPGEQLRDLVHAAASPAACADLLAASIVGDPDDRQTLLETLDPADRLDAVLERVSALVARLGSTDGMLN
jgi:hypothetical protein